VVFEVLQVGFTISKNGYDPEKRLEDCLTTSSFIKTLRSASVLSSDLQSSMVSVCFVLRSLENALAEYLGPMGS